MISHRGASALAPENTIAAFAEAKRQGALMIECDVMLSQDGDAFVFHDDTLARTTNGVGEFGLSSSAYLQQLDAGMWFSDAYQGERIPLFQDVIQWLIVNDMGVNIEIKPYPGSTVKTTLAVLSLLDSYWPYDKMYPLISSFDREALQLCHQMAPHLPLGFLMKHWERDWLIKAEALQCVSIHIGKHIATKVRIQKMIAAGYRVYVYTVNNKRQANKFFQWGVDAVFSDYPALV